MKFLIFGTGEYYNRYKIWFGREDILALIDNSKEKQGRYIDGIRVVAPEDAVQYVFDAVVILSFYVKAMKSQLMDLGVDEDKIYHFFELRGLRAYLKPKRERHFYGAQEKGDGKVLLLNHDLTLGGPALALYHAAQVLIKNGYRAVYGSMMDGPLRNILLDEGIPVVVDENLALETMEEVEWIGGYSLIICNTMNFHVFLSERDKKVPVVWWLHDALFFYDGVRREVMRSICRENMRVWSVGAIPEKAVKTFRPDFHVEDLLYGVEDQNNQINQLCQTGQAERSVDSKLRFMTIGYIEYRKGQDILLEAIKGMEPDLRRRAEFFFVGQNISLMAKGLIEASGAIPEIVVAGPVGREEINSLLEQTDILVCPSREDPMPTVAVEAMMHSVPCLISDSIGTVKYIRDKIDGMIFQSENAEQLKEILECCVRGWFRIGRVDKNAQNKKELEKMGKNARKIYERYFSMETFERRFMSLVEGIRF
ncbi:MAG: glycosyltransferase family 4 protein [Dorea sp.]|nr:glycosyltransferase family 4 protein [Dorea sp.]